MILLVLAGVLHAADTVPWAAPWEVQTQYDRWLASKALAPQPLACEELWAGEARLCFKVEESGRYRRQLKSESSLESRASAEAAAAPWIRAELETVPIDGMPSYRRLRDADGRAVFGVLDPSVLADELGLPFLVALPSTGVLVAWASGNPTMDKVMAVGVVELHQVATDPVSSMVYGWDGRRWFPFAEATPKPADSP